MPGAAYPPEGAQEPVQRYSEGYLYHYTTRENLRSILYDGIIRSGVQNKTFLKPERYVIGAEVKNRLGIVQHLPEVAIQLRSDLILTDVDPSPVDRIVDGDTGEILASGGGLELAVEGGIPLPILIFDLI